MLRYLLSGKLLLSLAVGERVGLSKEVRHELVVIAHHLIWQRDSVLRPNKSNEVRRYDATLRKYMQTRDYDANHHSPSRG